MQTCELGNPRCAVTITPERGGRITSFLSRDKNRSPDMEHVGANHLQTWAKSGSHTDPAAGMLHLFLGDFYPMTFEVARATARSVELSARSAGFRFRKRFKLSATQPLLTVELKLTNESSEERNVQLEGSFCWSFGAAAARPSAVTTILYPGEPYRHYPKPYGAVESEVHPATAPLAICDTLAHETLLIQPGTNWWRYTIYQMAGLNFRGPYSIEKVLKRGESLEADLTLAVVQGVGAVDTLGTGRVRGLLPNKAVWFRDEELRATIAAGGMRRAPKRRVVVVGRAGGIDLAARPLELSGKALTGDTLPTGCKAGLLRAGDATIESEIDGHLHRAAIRVFDDPLTAAPLVVPAKRPAFPFRVIHLIGSQQSTRGLTLDGMKWFVENAVAPCGYTHIVWEFNQTLKLRSHPELAAEGAFSHKQIGDLVKFCRSLGVEPIPQQNLFGHQHESGLLRAYPELQEGIHGSVYCPSNPRTRDIVRGIVTELLEIFGAKLFHMGHDEVQFHGTPQTVGVCPLCRQRKPWEVFADDVNQIDEIVKRFGGRSILWGDMLISPAHMGQNVNGLDGEVYRAIDLIPRDAIIADWHYFAVENYTSTDFFRQKGFDVWGAVWFPEEGIRKFAHHAHRAGALGMIYTTWCRPDITSVPIEGMIYAAQCFQDLASVEAPGLDEGIMIESHKLWRRWERRSDRPARSGKSLPRRARG